MSYSVGMFDESKKNSWESYSSLEFFQIFENITKA